MVVTQSLRYRLTGNGPIEQATKGRTVYRDGLNAKPDDPSGKDIHNDQDPVTFEESGFHSKQVHTP